MSASFSVQGKPTGRAAISVVGLDAEGAPKIPIRLSLNGRVLYQGPDPLPNDFCCGPSGNGNWGTVTISFPASLLKHDNVLTLTNLDPSGRILYPVFVMVDRAQVSYSTRR